MTFINIPVEWFSIGFDWTWMLLFGDIRQGIFYAMLLSFWIIFCGEHMMVRAPWVRQNELVVAGVSSRALESDSWFRFLHHHCT